MRSSENMENETSVPANEPFAARMRSQVSESVAKTSACVRNVALYGRFHPVVQELTESSSQALQAILDVNPRLVIMVSDSDLILDSFPLTDNTDAIRSFARLLWNAGIGELSFLCGITGEEILGLAEILSLSAQEIGLRGGIERELDQRGITHISIGGCVLPSEFREGTDPAQIYDEALMLIEEAMVAVQSGLSIRIPEIRAVVSDSLQSLMADESSLLALTNIRSYDRYLSEHSVNVSILSMVLARDLGIDTAGALELGVSAMLHDVGKVFISKDVVAKPGKLTEQEWEQMRRHPAEGARALAAMQNMPPLAPTVALEHHIYCDGAGYPALTTGQTPHLWSRLVAIVDTYDALTTDRPYRERWSAEEAIAWMLYETANRYDRQLLARFASRARLFPIGSIVKLTSGETAIIVGGTRMLPHRPRMRILEERDGALVPTEIVDLAQDADSHRSPIALAQPVEVLLRYTDRLLVHST